MEVCLLGGSPEFICFSSSSTRTWSSFKRDSWVPSCCLISCKSEVFATPSARAAFKASFKVDMSMIVSPAILNACGSDAILYRVWEVVCWLWMWK